MAIIMGNVIGGSAAPLKTLVLQDPSGIEIWGTVTESEQVLTAIASQDIREGKTAVTSDGVVVGSKRIPAYETTQEKILILQGDEFVIPLSTYDKYNYTKFQCIISKFNTSFDDSVYTDKIVVDDCVYSVNSTDVLSSVTKNLSDKSIHLNITNNTEDIYVINYFTYKEID